MKNLETPEKTGRVGRYAYRIRQYTFNLQIPLFLACNTVVHAVVRLKLNDGASSFINFLRSAILKIEQAIRMFSSSVVLENCRFSKFVHCIACKESSLWRGHLYNLLTQSKTQSIPFFHFFLLNFDNSFVNSTDKLKEIVEDLRRLHGPTITSNFIRVNPAFTMSRPRIYYILFLNWNSVIRTARADFDQFGMLNVSIAKSPNLWWETF